MYKKIKKTTDREQSTYANSPLKAHRTKAKQGGVFVSATVLRQQRHPNKIENCGKSNKKIIKAEKPIE